MGDSSVEVTDENREASQALKAQAMEAISEGNMIAVIKVYSCLYTDAQLL